jgi:hypothetical protein
MTMLQSEDVVEQMSREALIAEMDNFSGIPCENCGDTGNWLVFKIFLNENDEVRDQFKINIFKENGQIYGKPEDGYYSPAEIDIAFTRIREAIDSVKGQEYLSSTDGTAFIMVDFIKEEPYSRVSIFDLDGLSLEEVSGFMDAIVGDKKPNVISKTLKRSLEGYFEGLKANRDNSLVIAQLQNSEEGLNLYLIAKDPDSETYYGILDIGSDENKRIMAIPMSNIEAMEVREVSVTPFRVKSFIESGIKSH